jgi:hypothetical protein
MAVRYGKAAKGEDAKTAEAAGTARHSRVQLFAN